MAAAANGSDAAPFSVEGKTAIVTGAGSGINLEFAALLLARKCNVVFADLTLRPEAAKVVDAHAQGTPRAVFAKTDVRNWGELARLFEIAQAEFGSLDLVCPGAGVFEPEWSNFWHPPGPGSASKDPTDGLGHYALLDINVSHPIRMTQLAISHFLNPPAGQAKSSPANPKRVVCIASIASETAMLAAPLYIASKWAISGFVRCMEMLEPTHGIRVNAVAPGMVKTPIWTAPEQRDKMAFINEDVDQWISTTEVAGAMLQLAESPDMVGGTVLEVGHQQMRPIPLFGNVGPSGPGHTLSNAAVSIAQVHEQINKPGWGSLGK